MSDETLRCVDITRVDLGRYEATNSRGGKLVLGSGGGQEFSPVELLLTAIAGCSAADVDHITSKRADPTRFEVRMTADKIRDGSGNHLANLSLSFDVAFPDDEGGDAARSVLADAAMRSHDRLCTVSRTVERATPISVHVKEQ